MYILTENTISVCKSHCVQYVSWYGYNILQYTTLNVVAQSGVMALSDSLDRSKMCRLAREISNVLLTYLLAYFVLSFFHSFLSFFPYLLAYLLSFVACVIFVLAMLRIKIKQSANLGST